MAQLLNALLHTGPVLLLLESNTPAETTKSAFSDGGGIFGAVVMLLIMLAVIVGAYFVTRWIAAGALRMQKGSRMRVVDRLPLGKDKSVVVVEIGGALYALGVANSAVTLLCELPEGAYDERNTPASPIGGDWKSIFQQNMNTSGKREPRRKVDEDELTRMAERMRKRSQSMHNQGDGHEEE